MEIHYTKHAAAYAKNLQDASAAEKVDTSKPLGELLSNISKYSTKLRNNAGGHYNHELFWRCMSRDSTHSPTGRIQEFITRDFGNFETFKTRFTETAMGRFGSGWAWLYLNNEKKLLIGSTPNQDNPLMDVAEIKGFPVLGLDVWEHAYYLKYQNKRAEYIENWWKVVDWNYINERFSKIA
jgi:superoxide dismutase, Fe-Mn family